MVKQLRRKFILVAMCSVLTVLAVVIGVINVVNYRNVVGNADRIIGLLKEGGGSFGGMHGKPMSPETPFETRYFSVVLDAEGNAVAVNVEDIAAIGAPDAAAYAEELYRNGRISGFYGVYRYGVTGDSSRTMYIFVDCTKDLSSFRNFLWVSIIVSVVSFFVIFVLVFIFSGKVMKPVADSYAKQKRFITDAGHEIKTPLTIIGADAEVLEMQDGANEWTQSIKEQVVRLTALTEKLIFLARMEEGGQELRFTDFCISDAVEETLQTFSAVAIARGTELQADVRPNLTYHGDENMIRQLVSLLVDNALKYSDGDSITLSLHAIGNKMQLCVKNRASYLADGDLNVLFGRFYRGDRSRNSETGGHGIGLSVVHAIVAAHKGKVTARKEGDTVTFTVVF